MKTKLLAGIGIGIAASTLIFAGCSPNTPPNGIVVRKMVENNEDINTPNAYVLWVETKGAGRKEVRSYEVKQSYYDKVNDGDEFDPQYAVSSGVTEYEVVD